MAAPSTAASAVIAFDELARHTGASADIVNYLAPVAPDEDSFVRAVIEPLFNDFTDSSGIVAQDDLHVAGGHASAAQAIARQRQGGRQYHEGHGHHSLLAG